MNTALETLPAVKVWLFDGKDDWVPSEIVPVGDAWLLKCVIAEMKNCALADVGYNVDDPLEDDYVTDYDDALFDSLGYSIKVVPFDPLNKGEQA